MADTTSTWQRVYLNRRMAALLALGFASGLPSASVLLGSTLQYWLGTLKYSVKEIGLSQLVTLPVALHFVWAPLLDRYEPPGALARLGRRRGWLVVIQVLLIGAIALMAWTGPREMNASLAPFMAAAALVAFLSASQDTVADAYRTDVLKDEELGAGAAVFVNGYRLAMLAAGSGALMLSTLMPWPTVYLLMACLMVVGLLGAWLAPPPPATPAPLSLREAVVEPAAELIRRKGAAVIAVLLFIVLFKLPDAMGNAMVMPLLQTKLGFDADTLSWRQGATIGAVIVGALVGGGLEARLGLMRSLWLFALLQALSNAGFMALAMIGRSVPALMAVSVVESFCAGLATTGFIAFLMSQCNRQYSATQYALFTSLMFGAGSLVASMTGFLVERLGYVEFFGWTIVAALPGMGLLVWMGRADGVRATR